MARMLTTARFRPATCSRGSSCPGQRAPCVSLHGPPTQWPERRCSRRGFRRSGVCRGRLRAHRRAGARRPRFAARPRRQSLAVNLLDSHDGTYILESPEFVYVRHRGRGAAARTLPNSHGHARSPQSPRLLERRRVQQDHGSTGLEHDRGARRADR